MSLTTESALESLSNSALPVGDARQEARLAHISELLLDDLSWVEATLARVSRDGEAPATAAARHLIENGGKRVRPTATLLSASCFGAITPSVRELSVVVELVHNATLLHDDVIDEGMERRGASTSRLMWGNAVSVLAGDVLLVHALRRTQSELPALMPDLLEMLFRLVSGEVVQLRGRASLDTTRERYEQVLADKTASLFNFAASNGARLAGASTREQQALGVFGEGVGMAFQLVDDVLDYSSETTGKTLCADLREGKITLPLVLAVEQEPALLAQLQCIHQGDGDELVARVHRRVMELGVCRHVVERARLETQRAVSALEMVPASDARELLRSIALELVERVS